MPYRSNAPIQALYDDRPLRAACGRITEGVNELLEKEVTRRTPVAHPPPGVGPIEFMGMRGRAPGTARKSWMRSGVEEGVGAGGHARFSAETYSEDPVMPFIEWDTAPHVIRPRLDRRAASVIETTKPRRMGDDPMARLRFVNRHGRVVYAAEVHHPGTQGRHMMRDSLMEVDATWPSRVGDPEMARWAREQERLVV